MELKLIDVGIMSVTEVINVHEIVNFSTLVEKADLLLYTLYLNIFETLWLLEGRILILTLFKPLFEYLNMIFKKY